MTRPIALQLYSLREQLAEDFEGTVRRVADIGYAGVETAGFPASVTPAQAKSLFDDLGLTVCSAHAPLPLGDKRQEALDLMATLGTKRMVSSYVPPEEYASVVRTMTTIDHLNEAAAVAADNGLRFGVHNHWWEFEPLPDSEVRPYQLWLRHLEPWVFFELDTYWVQVGGVDPVVALAAMGDRVELLHVKDGPADGSESNMTAVGQGVVDYEAIIPAAPSAEWLIVELDRCATDMLTAVETSYRYLVDKGYGHGTSLSWASSAAAISAAPMSTAAASSIFWRSPPWPMWCPRRPKPKRLNTTSPACCRRRHCWPIPISTLSST